VGEVPERQGREEVRQIHLAHAVFGRHSGALCTVGEQNNDVIYFSGIVIDVGQEQGDSVAQR